MKRVKESNVDALARLKRTEVKDWTVDDVGIWLDMSGLSEYRAEFMKQSVSGAELQDLESEDLTELGMVKMGHKKRFQRRLKLLSHGLDSAFAQSEDGSSEDSTSFSSSSEKSGASTSSAPKRDKVAIKCYCGEDISVLHLPSEITLPRLKSKLKKEYGARMMIKYKDKEGSKVRMKKTTQLTKALKLAINADEPLRLWLYERKKKVSHREQSVLDTMIDAIVTINGKGKVVFFNKAAENLWGYSRNEVVKRNVNMLMPEEIASRHDDYLKNYAKTREARIIGVGRSVQAKHKNGTIMNVHLSVVETRQGENTVFTATIRKDTSVAAASSSDGSVERSVFALLNQLLDACVVINESGIVQFWNSAAEKKFGWKSTEIIGNNIKMMMPKSEGDRHDSYMQRYMRTNEAHIIGIGRDVVAQRKDGSVCAVHLSVTEQSLGGGKRLFTGVMREVEEEMEKAKSVLQQEREVLDNLIVPAIIIDQTGKIHGFNEAATTLLGFSLLDVVSRNVKMLMPPEMASKHDGFIADYLKTGQRKIIGFGRDVVAQHKSGALVPVHLSITEKRDGDKLIFTGILQKKD